LRFDFSVIGYINGILILLFLIPGKIKYNKLYFNILKWIFIIVNSLLLMSNIADSEYYKFTRKRATVFIFDLIGFGNTEADATRQIPQFMLEYWYVSIIWILLTIALIFSFGKNKFKISNQIYSFKIFILEIFIFLITGGFLIIAARGGFQLKPISVISASEYAKPEDIPLVINTPFSIMKSFGHSDLKEKNYFNQNELSKYFNLIKQNSTTESFKKLNVVVLILESFSKEYIGSLNNNKKGYTPFLDSLISESYLFVNSYANGTQSIEAVPSIISGIPALSENPFITSAYNTNEFESLSEILKNENYQTAFFHGGNSGTMGFDNFAKRVQVENIYERTEYANDADYDGRWGIFDEPFLQFTANKLNTFKQPFFSYIFTLSSHHPYTIPEKYKNKFKDGDIPIEKAISYADFSLQKFFETSSKMQWYQNTLFILTADHAGPAFGEYYKNPVGRYAIPIIFYQPSNNKLKGKNDSTIANQIDIMPTILNYLNYKKPFFSFGKNVFNTSNNSYSINYIEGIYQIVSKEYALFFDGTKTLGIYNLKTDSLLRNNITNNSPEIKKEMENNLKAFIQIFNNSMIKNKLTTKNVSKW